MFWHDARNVNRICDADAHAMKRLLTRVVTNDCNRKDT